jgi:hypothetical protein
MEGTGVYWRPVFLGNERRHAVVGEETRGSEADGAAAHDEDRRLTHTGHGGIKPGQCLVPSVIAASAERRSPAHGHAPRPSGSRAWRSLQPLRLRERAGIDGLEPQIDRQRGRGALGRDVIPAVEHARRLRPEARLGHHVEAGGLKILTTRAPGAHAATCSPPEPAAAAARGPRARRPEGGTGLRPAGASAVSPKAFSARPWTSSGRRARTERLKWAPAAIKSRRNAEAPLRSPHAFRAGRARCDDHDGRGSPHAASVRREPP